MPKRVTPGSLTSPYQKPQDFSPDLVGNQLTSRDGNSFFTFGNFNLTSNSGNISGQFLNTGEFSDVITLDTLDLSDEKSKKITEKTNNLTVRLKTNPNKLTDYVYFSDARKFIEVEVTDIINKWKGGLYIRRSFINDTVTDFKYNQNKDISYFTLSVNVLSNPYSLTTEIVPLLNTGEDDISFIQNSYIKYEISNEYGEFPIISYTGNTATDDYIKIETKGLAWPILLSTGTTSGSFEYYLKPTKETLEELFFDNLSPFQSILMNENSLPKKYTVTLSKSSETALGQGANNQQSFTWPTSDGFNLDYVGRPYGRYLDDLIGFAGYFDTETTNIMVRKLVAEAIFEFDTPGDGINPQSGQKMNKLIKIWGREFDKIKTYIDSISFANVLTYDGIENTPDELIKLMASNLGFDTIQSFSDNDLIKFFQKTSGGVFNSQQTNISLSEMDLELWRRLVINAWWLFKSKGTRKVIEFFLNLFNIDECLVSLDEIVYVAENKINYPEFVDTLLNYYGFLPDDNQLYVDFDGYPKILPDTVDHYFQLNGFWYDGGVGPNTKPDVKGNNPHFGPYDYGKAYFEKYTCLLTNFTPVNTLTELNLLTFNYFTDYTLGSVEGTGQIIVEGNNLTTTTETGVGNTLVEYVEEFGVTSFYAGQMNEDRVDNATVLNAGRDDETSNSGLSSFHINFFTGDKEECILENCPSNINFSDNGTVTYIEQDGLEYTLTNFVCCENFGYENYLNIEAPDSSLSHPCYWCPPIDNWVTTPVNQNGHIELLILKSTDGQTKKPTKECCIKRNNIWETPNTIGQNGEFIELEPYCRQPDTITVGGLGG